MRGRTTIAFFGMMMCGLLVGCTPRPSAADQTAIEKTVSHFRRAWVHCDPTGVRECLLAETPQQQEFVAEQVDVLAARVRLREAYKPLWKLTPYSSIFPNGPDFGGMINPKLDFASQRAWQEMRLEKDGSVRLLDAQKHDVYLMRQDETRYWRIDPVSFGDLAAQIRIAREDTRFANEVADELTAAINSQSVERLDAFTKSLPQRMIQHYHRTDGADIDAVLRALENPPGGRRVTTDSSYR